MDRAIDAAAAEQRRIRRVDDGIDLQGGDVSLDGVYLDLCLFCHREVWVEWDRTWQLRLPGSVVLRGADVSRQLKPQFEAAPVAAAVSRQWQDQSVAATTKDAIVLVPCSAPSLGAIRLLGVNIVGD
jgi:hypothetical protein